MIQPTNPKPSNLFLYFNSSPEFIRAAVHPWSIILPSVGWSRNPITDRTASTMPFAAENETKLESCGATTQLSQA
jgi:hypothetical protein